MAGWGTHLVVRLERRGAERGVSKGLRGASVTVRVDARLSTHLAVGSERRGVERGVSERLREASATVRVDPRLGTHLAVGIRASRGGEGRRRSERGVSDGERRDGAGHSPGGRDRSGEGRRGASASV